MGRRPLSITIIGWLFIGVGCVSLVRQASRLISDLSEAGSRAASAHAHRDMAYAMATALLALVAGAFVLRGRNWARWLCAAWLGFHVMLSIGHSVSELAVHLLLFVFITILLFRQRAGICSI